MNDEAIDARDIDLTALGTDRAVKGKDDVVDKATSQYISFRVGEEEYGVDIMLVREIKGWVGVTSLPNTPKYMRGVLNLRGIIVPIFDLRCRFGMDRTEATNLHVVVIVQVGERTMGILVDAVSDILTVTEDDINSVPDIDQRQDGEYLNGLLTVDDRMVGLLNLNALFNLDAIASGAQMAG